MNLLKIVRKVITIGILIVIPVITHALPARSPDFWTCPFCHALKAKVPGVVEVGTCLLDTLRHGDFGLSFVLAGHCSYFAQVKKSMQSHLESSKLWKAPKRGLDREHTSGILFISVKFQNVWDTQSSQPDFTGIYCLNWQIMETMDYKYKYKYMHITNSMIYIYICLYIVEPLALDIHFFYTRCLTLMKLYWFTETQRNRQWHGWVSPGRQGTDPLPRVIVTLVGLVLTLRVADLALQVALLGLIEVLQTWRNALEAQEWSRVIFWCSLS